jgi:hypothetical protein
MNVNADFCWECQPQAEAWLLKTIQKMMQTNSIISELEEKLLLKTSTRLFDWIDHLVVFFSEELEQELLSLGFSKQQIDTSHPVYHHLGAQFPRIVLEKNPSQSTGLAICVDSIAEFLMVRGGTALPIEGSIFGGYRKCCLSQKEGVALWVVERRGTQTLEPTIESSEIIQTYQEALELWMKRDRSNLDESMAMQETLSLVEKLVDLVGQNRAAWTVLEGERRYWQSRNTAGQIQKNRQDRLGMGWANHDHHTFRSSRRYFHELVRLFEGLGFTCRERFYAGEEAGWGAQVMEHSICRLVLFLDVDLASHEIEGDIAHQFLPELPHLGTIGLWCALHGDSILNSGMHHLEAQFMFDALTEDSKETGIRMMHPFSSFPYLKQAFTEGEKWRVDPLRIQRLLENNKISQEHATRFLTQGAVGSHLENLQRREGYKGFNQKNVSIIIKKTDPRSKF